MSQETEVYKVLYKTLKKKSIRENYNLNTGFHYDKIMLQVIGKVGLL